jgi:hypothetical protein
MQNGPLATIMQVLNTGVNPQFTLQQLVSQNPQLQVMLNQAQQSGMSPRDYVLQFAKQNNINIQPLVSMLGQRGIRL